MKNIIPTALPAAPRRLALVAGFTVLLALVGPAAAAAGLDLIRPSRDGSHFVTVTTGAKFTPWGFNYDHDDAGRLLEDYWQAEWPTVIEDFREMKTLGANVVRVHLQLGRFLKSPRKPNAAALEQLARLLQLAEETGLYLDLTGLGCYHKQDVPAWFAALGEAERWEAQAAFWTEVARIGADSPAVFCYDLINEPLLPGARKPEKDWLAGELGGKFFMQRLTLDLAGRTPAQVARQWIDKMAGAIRAHDTRHMITLGEVPWNLVFPGAKSLFHSQEVGAALDFVSVHFYPKAGEVDKALAALAAYDLGKPVLIEEMFPLSCSVAELGAFVDGSRAVADGWIGFYWGKTIEEYGRAKPSIAGAITRAWLEFFRERTPAVLGAVAPESTRPDNK
jgi:hypothetical protein